MPNLYEKICVILRNEWDPIGVGNSSGAIHEYDGYAQSIVELLLERKSRQDIIEYLWWAETENMGLSGDPQNTERVADLLKSLHA